MSRGRSNKSQQSNWLNLTSHVTSMMYDVHHIIFYTNAAGNTVYPAAPTPSVMKTPLGMNQSHQFHIVANLESFESIMEILSQLQINLTNLKLLQSLDNLSQQFFFMYQLTIDMFIAQCTSQLRVGIGTGLPVLCYLSSSCLIQLFKTTGLTSRNGELLDQ